MKVLILALILLAGQPSSTTVRECLLKGGYTARVYDVIENGSYFAHLSLPIARFNLGRIIDAPALDVSSQYETVLRSTRLEPANYAHLLFNVVGTGHTAPEDADPDIARVRHNLYANYYGENRRVLFVESDLDGDGQMELYAFVYQHLYEPDALTVDPAQRGVYGWHGSCTLRISP